ncbi:SDR family oxidoreductase [Nonomuraea sp. JJY05]|uniref:SDR family oxidoreductase n=1 Tax=Nonomuraea sp. JJY05 TaxID=3350255 RepID=UPI00373EE400
MDEELVAALDAGDEPAAMARAQQITDASAGGGGPIYGSTKYAVTTWVRRSAALASWAGAGIALNVIAPGVVETPMMADALSTAEGRNAVAAILPAPLNGPAPATAPAALLDWLLSVENSHVTGQVVFIDGGAESLARAPRF